MRNILSVCFLLCFFQVMAQTPLESIENLKEVLSANPTDSVKIKALGDLCWYYRNVNSDSAFAYGNRALKLSKERRNLLGEAQAYNDIGILHYDRSEYDKALNFYQKSLSIRESLKDSLGVAALYNKIGLVYQNTFLMDSSMQYATKALAIYMAKQKLRYAAVMQNNIANIQKGTKQFKQALESHLKVAGINEQLKDSIALTRSYNNIANAYLNLRDTVNSIGYFKKGIALAKKNSYQKELAALYNNYAGILENKEKQEEALDLTVKSLEIRKTLRDEQGIASASLHLAGLYLNSRELTKAHRYLYSGLNIAESINANELKIDAYDKLTIYHAFANNTDSLIYYKNRLRVVRDSVFSQGVAEVVAELQEKYNKTEREKEILSQRTEIAEKELVLNRKNTQLIGLVLVAVLMTILGYLLYNQQKLKNRQLVRENELKQALIRIETQNRLQEQRLRISRDLHDNIGAQLTFIISSIENLQFGFKLDNNKLINKLSGISDFTKETINELRDTIWAMNKSDITLEDLQSRISNVVKKANAYATNIDFKFIIAEDISKEVKFTSIKGMNIYRIVQEAINNAMKYAEAKSVLVKISQNKDRLSFEITDDGKGFDENEIKLGNGLNNMRKRAEEIGADFSLDSKVGNGTSIKFKIIA